MQPEYRPTPFDMPSHNAFGHQRYSPDPPEGEWETLCVSLQPTLETEQDERRMAHIGTMLRGASVRVVYLVHGTFVGDDATGFIRNLSQLFPISGEKLRRIHKEIVDKLARDSGNYTTEFARKFEEFAGIPVRLFRWSSENHHIARAHAAVGLIDELVSLELAPDDRVLLWGHSHGGNVFALMTNLLASDQQTRQRFFRACRSYYRWPIAKRVDLRVWTRVRRLLAEGRQARCLPNLDLVTFGTPIRYGWDTDGYAKLLHFVHHRPQEGLPEYRTALPSSVEDVLSAAGGDYIQHLGIASTNFAPNAFAWRTWMADVRLGRFLQGSLRRRDLLQRLKAGMRVAEEGKTLLVDYGPVKGNVAQHLAGHAVYTRVGWLPFHAEQVARRFYGRD